MQGVDQGDQGAGDAGRARAAVGFKHVAVDRDRPLAERNQIDHGSQATADEPLGNLTAPRFLYLSSVVGDSQIGVVSGPVVIEAYVNGAGQVYDYRIISGPTDEATRAQVENLLLWSRFEPARRFGQPIPGLAVLSFSGVSVRG